MVDCHPEEGCWPGDLFGGDDFGRSFWDGSSFITQCICRDGIIFGNNIFDAVRGEPGTYLTLDMYGRLSWGFSTNLYQATWRFIDLIRITGGAYHFAAATSGYQVYIEKLGAMTVAAGFIPEYVAAQQAAWQKFGAPPTPPEDLASATAFYKLALELETDVLHSDDPKADAMIDVLYFFPDVGTFLGAAYIWQLQAGSLIPPVFNRYPGIVH
jgi:hypothetical protein